MAHSGVVAAGRLPGRISLGVLASSAGFGGDEEAGQD
jgi:hypothetical protein